VKQSSSSSSSSSSTRPTREPGFEIILFSSYLNFLLSFSFFHVCLSDWKRKKKKKISGLVVPAPLRPLGYTRKIFYQYRGQDKERKKERNLFIFIFIYVL
jgi:hypothetical protein